MFEICILKVGVCVMLLIEFMKKMSKFDLNLKLMISMFDELKIIEKKIKSVVIDFEGIVKFDKENKFGIFNLLIIYFLFFGKIVEEIEVMYEGKGYGDFKGDLV